MVGGLKDSVVVGKYTTSWIIQRGDCVQERMQAVLSGTWVTLHSAGIVCYRCAR
jgi:hypothetical protein